MLSSTAIGGVMAGASEVAPEYNVPVERGARDVRDRIVHLIALHQHRVQRGNAPAVIAAGTLREPRNETEHGGRVAAGGRGFARGEADLALGRGHPREAVEEEEDVAAFRAETLRNRGRRAGRDEAQRGGSIARGCDNHAASEGLGAEVPLDEISDFTATLTDKRDHREIRVRAAREHAQEGALAHARTGENAHALTATKGEEAIDRPDPRRQGLRNQLTIERIGRICVDRHGADAPERRAAIDGAAEPIENPAQEGVAHGCRNRVSRRHDTCAHGHGSALEERELRFTLLNCRTLRRQPRTGGALHARELALAEVRPAHADEITVGTKHGPGAVEQLRRACRVHHDLQLVAAHRGSACSYVWSNAISMRPSRASRLASSVPLRRSITQPPMATASSGTT